MKKFGTLQPKNWLAVNPQTLALRRLGRQSAERERISEIDWTFLKKNGSRTRFSLNMSSLKPAYGLVFLCESGKCFSKVNMIKFNGIEFNRIIGADKNENDRSVHIGRLSRQRENDASSKYFKTGK
ncbi:hypothetical protein [Peribacillus frigoritolerans]|uniref:Uncharacterized protein n=1 Tax=Peribacillus castrilensis TaxID=2897690 RepID=A0AAW9NCB2_9BACI|nr:hypothetical protein [Peribacillus castrilensis]